MGKKKQSKSQASKLLHPQSASSPAGALICHLLLAWLLSALLEYLFLPENLLGLGHLKGIAAMSMTRLLCLTGVFTAVLWLLSKRYNILFWERLAIPFVFLLLTATALYGIDHDALLILCGIILGVMAVYVFWGHAPDTKKTAPGQKVHWAFLIPVALLAAGFIAVVSIWTVGRLKVNWAPAFDFGIFAQMFHNMKETGLPTTTVERGKVLSHFAVHVSPIYYLMLPFYWLFPHNATLQILQAVILASAVIPIWLIGKQHGLSGLSRVLLCALVLVYPTTAGGTSYDLHENCFLLPLVLWLMYAIDRESVWMTALFAALTLMVKEDAAVYVAVAALYLIVRSAVNYKKGELKPLLIGCGVLLLSVGWFLITTDYLAKQGDGVMTYRYNNFIYDGSGSLFSVVKAVILCPMKTLYECVDAEKLPYITQTFFSLLGLPLLTRKFERYILLIPYILLNLMSDYQYQHDIFFQYNFGSSALLLYLTAVNTADLLPKFTEGKKIVRIAILSLAVLISAISFNTLILPEVQNIQTTYKENQEYYAKLSEALDTIPEDASVAAHSLYVTPLANRDVIYDVHNYCSSEAILKCEYVVLKNNCKNKIFNSDMHSVQDIITLVEQNGYEQVYKYGSLVIYRRTPAQ